MVRKTLQSHIFENFFNDYFQGTSFCSVITDRLTMLFKQIPKDLEIGMIEEVKVNWIEAHHLHSQGEDKNCLNNILGL